MIVREDMHTHYTQVSFKDEFQNTVVHSKNASWNQIHKETLNAFAFKFPLQCILSGRGIQNDRRGWRESRGDSGQKWTSREAKNGGDTSQKRLGIVKRTDRYKYRGVIFLVVSYTPSNFKSHLLLSKDKICDTSFYVLFFLRNKNCKCSSKTHFF